MSGKSHQAQRRNGQALIELALILPIFIVLIAISVDLSYAYGLAIGIHGAARAGSLQATNQKVLSDTCPPTGGSATTIGQAIRGASSDFPPGPATWGLADFCASQGCDTPAPTDCGDPQGCGADFSSGSWSAPACFSVGYCQSDPPALDANSCLSSVAWGKLPNCDPTVTDCSQVTIVVRVATRVSSFLNFGTNTTTISYNAFVQPEAIGDLNTP